MSLEEDEKTALELFRLAQSGSPLRAVTGRAEANYDIVILEMRAALMRLSNFGYAFPRAEDGRGTEEIVWPHKRSQGSSNRPLEAVSRCPGSKLVVDLMLSND